MKRFKPFTSERPMALLVLVAVLLILAVLVAALDIYVREPAIRSEMLAGLATTAWGIIIGLPIATFISKKQEESADRSAKARVDADRRTRQHKILSLIQHELAYDRECLSAREAQSAQEQMLIVNYPGVRSGLWQALSNSGDLTYIEDLDLLNLLAEVYASMEDIRIQERTYWAKSDGDFSRYDESAIRAATYVGNHQLKAALKAIDRALAGLDHTSQPKKS